MHSYLLRNINFLTFPMSILVEVGLDQDEQEQEMIHKKTIIEQKFFSQSTCFNLMQCKNRPLNIFVEDITVSSKVCFPPFNVTSKVKSECRWESMSLSKQSQKKRSLAQLYLLLEDRGWTRRRGSVLAVTAPTHISISQIGILPNIRTEKARHCKC